MAEQLKQRVIVMSAVAMDNNEEPVTSQQVTSAIEKAMTDLGLEIHQARAEGQVITLTGVKTEEKSDGSR